MTNATVDRRTTAQRKKAKMRDELRDKFKASEYIRQLEEAHKEYESMLQELELAKLKKRQLVKDKKALADLATQIDLIKLRIEIIKGKIDLNLRRLKFVLPELKSIELSDPAGDSPLTAFAQAVLSGAPK